MQNDESESHGENAQSSIRETGEPTSKVTAEIPGTRKHKRSTLDGMQIDPSEMTASLRKNRAG
jgi:hypothetical protein